MNAGLKIEILLDINRLPPNIYHPMMIGKRHHEIIPDDDCIAQLFKNALA